MMNTFEQPQQNMSADETVVLIAMRGENYPTTRRWHPTNKPLPSGYSFVGPRKPASSIQSPQQKFNNG